MNFDIIKNEKDNDFSNDITLQKYTDLKSKQVIKEDLENIKIDKDRDYKTELIDVERYVYIDSRTRDLRKYPKASDMVVSLDNQYENIKSIELYEICLPNAVQIINESNNNLYWSNIRERNIVSARLYKHSNSQARIELYKDFDIYNNVIIFDCPGFVQSEGEHVIYIISKSQFLINIDMSQFFGVYVDCRIDIGSPIYNISIFPGNYTLTSICSQIQSQMNNVRNISGDFHRFLVTPNTETDIINIRQFVTTNLIDNPIQVFINSNIIKVQIKNHGIKIGDTIALFDTVPVGNFTKNQLDGLHTITDVSDNDVSFELNVPSSSTTGGGGNNVLLGKQVSFKINFNVNNIDNDQKFNNLIDYNLGFAGENSSIKLENNPEAIMIDIDSVSLNGDLFTINTVQDITNYIHESTEKVIDNIIFNSQYIDIIITNHGLFSDTNIFIRSNCFIDVVYINSNIIDRNTIRVDRKYIKNNDLLLTTVFLNGSIYFSDKYVSFEDISFIPIVKDSYLFYVVPGSKTSNSFSVHKRILSYDIGTKAKVRTSLLSLNLIGHHFNNITNIESINSDFIKITTKLPHNLDGNIISNVSFERTISDTLDITISNSNTIDTQTEIYIESNNINNSELLGRFIVEKISSQVYRIKFNGSNSLSGLMRISYGSRTVIANTNCRPRLRNEYGTQKIDDYNFTIPSENGNLLTSSGNSGTLNYNNVITISRTERNTIPNFDKFNIVSNYFFDIIIVDEDNILINTFFMSGTNNNEYVINDQMFISSELYGFDIIQSNTEDWNQGSNIYRLIQLNGENYVFLCSRELTKDQDMGYNRIENVFSKIQLDVDSGALVFHQNVFSPIIYRPFLEYIKDIDLSLYQYNGRLFDILRLDYSMTLKITTQKQVVSNTLHHSKFTSYKR